MKIFFFNKTYSNLYFFISVCLFVFISCQAQNNDFKDKSEMYIQKAESYLKKMLEEKVSEEKRLTFTIEGIDTIMDYTERDVEYLKMRSLEVLQIYTCEPINKTSEQIKKCEEVSDSLYNWQKQADILNKINSKGKKVIFLVKKKRKGSHEDQAPIPTAVYFNKNDEVDIKIMDKYIFP